MIQPARHISRASIWSPLPFALLLLVASVAHAQQDVRVGVLSLFHPAKLELEQAGSQVIVVAETEAANPSLFVLNGEPGQRQLLLRAQGNRVLAGLRSAPSWTATARDGGAVAFRLTVPGRFHRAYFARLTIEARDGELLAVASMDRELAVASIVLLRWTKTHPSRHSRRKPLHPVPSWPVAPGTATSTSATPPIVSSSSRRHFPPVVSPEPCRPPRGSSSRIVAGLSRPCTPVVAAAIPAASAISAWSPEKVIPTTRCPAHGASSIRSRGEAGLAKAASRQSRATNTKGSSRRATGDGARSQAATSRPRPTAQTGNWKATASAIVWGYANSAQWAWLHPAQTSATSCLITIQTPYWLRRSDLRCLKILRL